MVIKINDTEIEMRHTFRAHIIYEQITGNTFAPKSITDVITFFYSTVMACNTEIAIDFNDFLDWMDDNPNSLSDFVNFLTENDKRQQALTSKETKPTTIKQPTKKKR